MISDKNAVTHLMRFVCRIVRNFSYLTDIVAHWQVNVREYSEYNAEYCAREGVLTMLVFVTLINAVKATKRMVRMMKTRKNTLVDMS